MKKYRPLARIVTAELPSPRLITIRSENVAFLDIAFTAGDRLLLLATPTSYQVSYGAWEAFAIMAKFLADVVATR